MSILLECYGLLTAQCIQNFMNFPTSFNSCIIDPDIYFMLLATMLTSITVSFFCYHMYMIIDEEQVNFDIQSDCILTDLK